MSRTRGIGIGTGMALGTAAIVREQQGVSILPAMPDRIAVLLAARRLTETPDIVLVARDYLTALSLSPAITWGRVVAIVAETSPENAPVSKIPAVINIPDVVSLIKDDVLVLVDADKSFAFPDPDPMFLAQYTAEHDRIAPKRRIYLDKGHTAAKTVDGRKIETYAFVDSLPDAELAVEQGADGLFLSTAAEFRLGAEMAVQKKLFALIHAAAGKPFLIADDYSLPPMLVCEACVEADITLLSPAEGGNGISGLRDLLVKLEEAENVCFDSDIPASVPRVGALLNNQPAETEKEAIDRYIDKLAESGASRLMITLQNSRLSEGILSQLDYYFSAALRNMLPVCVSVMAFEFNAFGQNELENSLTTAVQLLIGSGVSTIIVLPEAIAEAKLIINEGEYRQCQHKYWRMLEEAGR